MMRYKIPQVLKKSDAFTLIEVMVALIILIVGLMGLATLQLAAIKSNSFSSEMTYATMLGQQQAEYLKSLPFTDPNLQPGSNNSIQQTGKGVQYTISWAVSADNIPATNMRTIAISVTWQSLRQGGAGQSATEMTVASNINTIVQNL
jgi:Tfp pilus assembly protein PilV